ncbi:hypothetical protein MMC12_001979 [Toensbergia leucococca]|nr:hypothetical protein [Toensbergia leucococca]
MDASQPLRPKGPLSRYVVPALLVTLTIPHTTALEVLPDSSCLATCTKNSASPSTDGSDITCYDPGYNDTAVGTSFQNCVSCELQGQTTDRASGQTDLGTALYNMRYAVDWCLYGFPQPNSQTASNPCIESCAKLSPSMETNILTPNVSTPYDYCQNTDFSANVGICAYCISLVPNQLYLSNFLNVLKSTCQTLPANNTPFAIPPSQIFTLSPPSTYSTSASTTSSSSSSLPLSTKLAIGITIPIVIILLLAFGLYWYSRLRNSRPSRFQESYLHSRFGDPTISSPSHQRNRGSSYPNPNYGRPQAAPPSPLPLLPRSLGTVDKGKQPEMAPSPSFDPPPREEATGQERKTSWGKRIRDLTPPAAKPKPKPKIVIDTVSVPRRNGGWTDPSPQSLFG